MTGPAKANLPPGPEQFEVTLLGPGYGESIVLHVGQGSWIIVDSCIDASGGARPLQYLESIGVDPTEAVRLVVATHWHDDHIQGLGVIFRRAALSTGAVRLRAAIGSLAS